MLRRTAVALAFAVWCFLPTWVSLAEGDQVYFARFSPQRAVLPAVVLWEALLAAALLGAWKIRRRGRISTLAADRLFLLAGLLPLGFAGVAALRVLPFDVAPLVRRPSFWIAAVALGAVIGARALHRPVRAARALRNVFLYSWPVLALLIGQAARELWRFPASDFADRPLAGRAFGGNPRLRVVWILFDELSQDVAFRQRPASLRLPEFDRLRSESIVATAAGAPGPVTLTSLPALILGRRVERATPEGPGELSAQFEGAPDTVDWGGVPNVFDAARAMGYDTAVAGWYHPYGRILNRSLTQCAWVAGSLIPGVDEPSRPQGIATAMWLRARVEFEILPVLGHFRGVDPELVPRRRKLERLLDLLGQAEAFARNSSLGLVLLHLPAPHPPAVYDRATGRFTAEQKLSYLDGLACADEMLRRIRAAIAAGGAADRTVLVVSSDHGWRTGLWRGRNLWTAEDEATPPGDPQDVPFLLHFPRQALPVEFGASFDTIETRPILEAILGGRVATADDAVRMLDNRIRSAR